MNALPVGDFCTLPTVARPIRLVEFDELFRRQAAPPQKVGPHRVEFTFAAADGLYAQVSDLVARESACCSFFEFVIDRPSQRADNQDRLVLKVAVPESRADVLDALLDRALAAIAEAWE